MAKQMFPSAVRTATLVGDDVTATPRANAMTAVLDVIAVPGAQTVQLVIESKDPASGRYSTLLQSTARSTIGTEVLQVGPGRPVIANVSANAAVPQDYRIRVVHSGRGSFTYSVSVADRHETPAVAPRLPDMSEVDPGDIAAPVLTRQGWITPAPDSAIALRKVYAEAGQMSPGGGGERDLLDNAERMYQRLRTRHAGNPQRLAQLAEVRSAAGFND